MKAIAKLFTGMPVIVLSSVGAHGADSTYGEQWDTAGTGADSIQTAPGDAYETTSNVYWDLTADGC